MNRNDVTTIASIGGRGLIATALIGLAVKLGWTSVKEAKAYREQKKAGQPALPEGEQNNNA